MNSNRVEKWQSKTIEDNPRQSKMLFSKTKREDIIKKLSTLIWEGVKKEEKTELKEVKVDEIKSTYIVIKINAYTLEEEIVKQEVR